MMPFGFEIVKPYTVTRKDGSTYRHDEWIVQLPHHCDEWVITEIADHAEAVAGLERFIAEATTTLAVLKGMDA